MRKKTQDYNTTQGQMLLSFFNTYIRAAAWVEDMTWKWLDHGITDSTGTISIFPQTGEAGHNKTALAVNGPGRDLNKESSELINVRIVNYTVLEWMRDAARAQGLNVDP